VGKAIWSEIGLRSVAYVFSALILLPLFLIITVSFTRTSYITFPPRGFTLEWYGAALKNPRLIEALRVSLQVGILSAMLATAMGVIGAVFLSKAKGWIAKSATALYLSPITVPIIVLSIGLLFFLTRLGLVRSVTGLVIGHTVITFPYCVRVIGASLGRSLEQLERAAAVLGAGPLQVFVRVTLPSIRAGIVAALLFAFLISLNNVTIALFLAGARTQTLPLLMLQYTKDQVTPDIAALASLLVVVTFGVMIALERRFGMYQLFERTAKA